jgi:hypothetical protein
MLMGNPYKDNMQQVWEYGETQNVFVDNKYGFMIKRTTGKYFLYWKEKLMCHTYGLEAAKEISLVLINDRIMNG